MAALWCLTGLYLEWLMAISDKQRSLILPRGQYVETGTNSETFMSDSNNCRLIALFLLLVRVNHRCR